MFTFPFGSWYTDTFDSYRVIETTEGGITKHTRQQILTGAPCRAYRTPTAEPSMQSTAATVGKGNAMCCEVGTDIKAGDEIILYRSSSIKSTPVSTDRYFAGNINIYVEPFGGIIAGLEHVQVALYNEERID